MNCAEATHHPLDDCDYSVSRARSSAHFFDSNWNGSLAARRRTVGRIDRARKARRVLDDNT